MRNPDLTYVPHPNGQIVLLNCEKQTHVRSLGLNYWQLQSDAQTRSPQYTYCFYSYTRGGLRVNMNPVSNVSSHMQVVKVAKSR